jgi:C-terminal processing protease CtpA/Prc
MQLDSSALHRWRTARRLSLGAIVISGTIATAAAVTQRLAEHPCAHTRVDDGFRTFSGIGVVITQDGEDVVVTQVFAGAPAQGKLYPGAVLLSVDGERPRTLRSWASKIQGKQGTTVELEVAYPCSGHETVAIERDLVRVNHMAPRGQSRTRTSP